jgi:hypothetical protein
MIKTITQAWLNADLGPEARFFRSSLLFDFGNCPGGCDDGSAFHGPTGRVYRSSRRSLTMQCTKCTLQWTMTVHRLAHAAALKASGPNGCEELRVIAKMWADWASAVEERRGRRKAEHSTGAHDDATVDTIADVDDST